jgi:hypothetical protein
VIVLTTAVAVAWAVGVTVGRATVASGVLGMEVTAEVAKLSVIGPSVIRPSVIGKSAAFTIISVVLSTQPLLPFSCIATH